MTIPNTIIEAGAGSGKTYTIMQLLNEGLKSGQFEIDNVAVITFTRKAATELKERVMTMLQENSYNNKNLQKQLMNIGNAHISTIHSFCESLLKSLPIEAGIDPAFEILEEENMNNFFDNIFESWLTDKLENQPEELKLLCLKNNISFYPTYNLYGDKNDKSLQGLMKTVINHRELKLFDLEPPAQTLQELTEQFEANARKLISEVIQSEKLSDTLNGYLDNYLMAYKNEQFASSINKIKYKPGRTGGDENKELKEEWKALCEDYIPKAKFIALFPVIKECYQAFNKLGKNFCEYYRNEMRLTGVMDFTEILIKTEELLRKNKDARAHFKSKFKFLFIDEFQDTDPIQTHILFFLAEKPGEHANKWEDVNLAENKLCVVGDPKQSIYRFRRADIEIYSEVAEKITKQGERNVLKYNYRSAGKVLDWINNFFKDHLVKPANGNWQVDYQAIEIAPKKNREEGNAPNCGLDNAGEIIFVESDTPSQELEKGWGADAARDHEAKVTAKWIKEHGLQHGEYKDILVLYRKKKNMQATADMLEELGVPCEVVGGKSFFARQEILDLNIFMRAVVDPLDSVSIVAALRGPFFALTDAQLCEWKLEEKYKHLFAYNGKITENFDPEHIVSKALICLNQLHIKSHKVSAYKLLQNELTERKLLVSYRSTWHGSRSVMNIIKALELLKDYDKWPCRKAVEELSKKIESKSDMTDFSEYTGKNNAVQLMTIYGAKGLQSKIVYLADTTSTSFPPNGTYIDNRNGILYYTLNISCMTKTKTTLPQMNELKNIEICKINAEESRLRYVATTRAIKTLVINHRPLELGKQYEDTIYRCLESECIETVKLNISGMNPKYHISVPAGTNNIDFKQQWNDRKEVIDESVQLSSRPSMTIISPSLADNSGNDPELNIKIVYDSTDYIYRIEPKLASHIGILVHKLLELQPTDLQKAAQTLIRETGKNIKPEVLIERYKVVKTQTEKLCKDAINIMHEVPIKYLAESGIYYDGIIDLLIEKSNGWTLVDYKILSADYTEEELKNKYKSQLNVYAEGLKQLGLTIEKVVILQG